MTTQVTITTDDENEPDGIAASPEPIAAPVVETPPVDHSAEISELREATAATLEMIADDIGDIQDVVAALVSGMDSVVDYLRELHEAEKAEGHTDISPPVEATQKVEKAKKEQRDVEPNPRSRAAAFFLGRSGGMYR